MAEHDNHPIKIRDGAAVWREVDGEIVLLALDSSEYIGLNKTATALWPAMTQGATRGELVSLLAASFDVDRDRAASDVDSFVDTCRAHRLLS